MHLLLSAFAIEYGESVAFVKEYYFKKLCNAELFERVKQDPHLGKITVLRSTTDLDTKELSLAIDRFRNWSASHGIYLPEANEHFYIDHILNEMELQKQWS